MSSLKEKIVKKFTRVPKKFEIKIEEQELSWLRKNKLRIDKAQCWSQAFDFIEEQRAKIHNVPFVEVVSHKIEADLLNGTIKVTIEYSIPDDSLDEFANKLSGEVNKLTSTVKKVFAKAKTRVETFGHHIDQMAEKNIEKGLEKTEQLKDIAEDAFEKFQDKAEDGLKKVEILAEKLDTAFSQKTEKLAEDAVIILDKAEALIEDVLKPGGKIDKAKSSITDFFDKIKKKVDRVMDENVDEQAQTEKVENQSTQMPPKKKPGRKPGSKNKPKNKQENNKK